MVYIIGVGFVGVFGLATTWYAGRKKHTNKALKMEVNLLIRCKLLNEMEKSVSEKTES